MDFQSNILQKDINLFMLKTQLDIQLDLQSHKIYN